MLIVFCGSIGSGKSTNAKLFLADNPDFHYTSIDKIRPQVYNHEQNLNEDSNFFHKILIFMKEHWFELRSRQILKQDVKKQKNIIYECLGCRYYNKNIIKEYQKKYPKEKVKIIYFIAEPNDLKQRIINRVESNNVIPYPQSWRFIKNKFLSHTESLLVGLDMCLSERLVLKPNLMFNTSAQSIEDIQISIRKLINI
jgi:adenylate kinase family enzyme